MFLLNLKAEKKIKEGSKVGVVSELSLQKNKSRANVFLDGVFVCGLDVGVLVKNGIKVGTEVSEKILKELQIESDKEKAYEKALCLIERQKYTSHQLRNKLSMKGYDKEIIDECINKLKNYGFISDKDFAESFIRSTKTKSKKEIENALFSKGVSCEVVENAIASLEVDDEQTAYNLSVKFMKYKEPSKENIKKLVAYLYRKGFSFSLAQSVAKQFNDDCDF